MIGFKEWLTQGQPKTKITENKKINGRPKTIDAVNNGVNNGVTYRALIARIKAALH